MKKFLKKLNKVGSWFFLVWIFTIPFQFYLNSGVSLSISLFLLVPLLFIVGVNIYLERYEGLLKGIYRYWIIILISLSLIASSFLNIGTYEVKELLRWGLFLFELTLLLEALRLKIVTPNQIVIPLILSSSSMILITFYQLFIPQEVELSLMKGAWGQLFNDPDFIRERFAGLGKFNWLYGNSIRVHGVFANVSHFSFLLGASLLLLIREYKDKWSWKYSVIGAVFFAFVTMSLVRSVGLSLILIFAIYLIIYYRKKQISLIRILGIMIVGGTLLSLFLGFLSYERIIFYSLLVRFFETVSFDGALFPTQMEMLKEYFDRLKISTGQFNEYGGVGGRLALLKITVSEVIMPRVSNIAFLLFGVGPASLPYYIKDTANEYFGAFKTVDNSYLQWFVEIGLAPFILIGIYVKKNMKKVSEVLLANWDIIAYIVINAFFFNLLPDIRVGMIMAVLISYNIYNRGK
jgi:hypothetical protein